MGYLPCGRNVKRKKKIPPGNQQTEAIKLGVEGIPSKTAMSLSDPVLGRVIQPLTSYLEPRN